jgi:HEAT repeat protein
MMVRNVRARAEARRLASSGRIGENKVMVKPRTPQAALSIALLMLVCFSVRAFPQEPSPTTESQEPGLVPGDACPESVDQLIVWLRSGNSASRWAAAECLGETRDSRAVEHLVQAIFVEQYPRLVMIEENALRKIDDPRTADLLLDALKPKKTRWIAAYALGNLQISRAVDPLLSLLKSTDKEDRRTAAEALGRMKDPRAIDALCGAFTDKDEVLRRYAASALGQIGDARAVDSLVAALDDADDGVRWNAANSLGNIKDSRAVEPLAA